MIDLKKIIHGWKEKKRLTREEKEKSSDYFKKINSARDRLEELEKLDPLWKENRKKIQEGFNDFLEDSCFDVRIKAGCLLKHFPFLVNKRNVQKYYKRFEKNKQLVTDVLWASKHFLTEKQKIAVIISDITEGSLYTCEWFEIDYYFKYMTPKEKKMAIINMLERITYSDGSFPPSCDKGKAMLVIAKVDKNVRRNVKRYFQTKNPCNERILAINNAVSYRNLTEQKEKPKRKKEQQKEKENTH